MRKTYLFPFLIGMLLFGCSVKEVPPAKEEAVEPLPRFRIACLGDSITEGMGVDDPENLWINVIGREAFIEEMQNVGLSGTTVAVPPSEYLRPYAYVNRYHDIDTRADLIIVFGGTNDYGNDVPLGSPDDIDPCTFFGALNTLAAGFSADYPDAKVLFLTPLQRDDRKLGSPTTTPLNYAGVSMEDYCTAIRSVCEENGFALLDLYHLEGMRLEDPSFDVYFDDGLHPNDTGSTFLAGPILNKIREVLGIES